jgi:cytochrome c-type biogenesis protein CcmH/NrfF
LPDRAVAVALLLLGLFTFLGVRPAFAQQDNHARTSTIVLDDLSVENRQRARSVWSHVICSCPKENFSKTLTNCPDGCADPQKQLILAQIQQGLSNDQIFDLQVQQWGTKIMAKPDDALTYALPAFFLLACAGVTLFALTSWRRNAAAAHAAHHMDVPPEAGELAAVERELEELR